MFYRWLRRPGRTRGRRDHRHEETGSGEPLILAMNKTFVADRLSSPKESHPDRTRRPGTGFVGTDFWHAVEFSRNGRAPVRVSRPVVGQPLHAMSVAIPLSKRSDPALERGQAYERARTPSTPPRDLHAGQTAPAPAQ